MAKTSVSFASQLRGPALLGGKPCCPFFSEPSVAIRFGDGVFSAPVPRRHFKVSINSL